MDVQEVRKPVLQKRRRKNRETKTVLVFDEAARREYLTGFRKRKNERRKKAQLENEKKIKEEKQALKQKVRDIIQKSDRHRLPEVEEFLKNSKVYDMPEHTVTMTDLSESLGPKVSMESDTEQQEKSEEEDAETLKKKKKKLINKLAEVGNQRRKKKVKRLNSGKFQGGGGSGGKVKSKNKSRSHRKGKAHHSNKSGNRHR